jgi:hypothetical protein
LRLRELLLELPPSSSQSRIGVGLIHGHTVAMLDDLGSDWTHRPVSQSRALGLVCPRLLTR